MISCTAHPHELPEGTVLSYHYHQQKRAQGLAPVGDQQILERKHPEQTPNILLKKILGILSCQEQPNNLTILLLAWHNIPVAGTEYVLNKYLLTKEARGWGRRKACDSSWEVLLRYEECATVLDKGPYMGPRDNDNLLLHLLLLFVMA